jgi:hypothetical protein
MGFTERTGVPLSLRGFTHKNEPALFVQNGFSDPLILDQPIANAALGEMHLFADLGLNVPAGLRHRRRDELDANAAFA